MDPVSREKMYKRLGVSGPLQHEVPQYTRCVKVKDNFLITQLQYNGFLRTNKEQI